MNVERHDQMIIELDKPPNAFAPVGCYFDAPTPSCPLTFFPPAPAPHHHISTQAIIPITLPFPAPTKIVMRSNWLARLLILGCPTSLWREAGGMS